MTSARTCPRRNDATAYGLGTLPEREHAGFDAHLESGCMACRTAVAAVRRTLAEMDLSLVEGSAALDPGDDLKRRLMDRIREEQVPSRSEPRRAWQHWSGDPAQHSSTGPSIVRAAQADFEATDFEGIEVRPLSVDSRRETVTMLVRMAPGSSYPRHRHATREECFVLSGDLQVGDESMGPGDYQVAPGGSIHAVQSTRSGCTLLIVSSQRDQLLE